MNLMAADERRKTEKPDARVERLVRSFEQLANIVTGEAARVIERTKAAEERIRSGARRTKHRVRL